MSKLNLKMKKSNPTTEKATPQTSRRHGVVYGKEQLEQFEKRGKHQKAPSIFGKMPLAPIKYIDYARLADEMNRLRNANAQKRILAEQRSEHRDKRKRAFHVQEIEYDLSKEHE